MFNLRAVPPESLTRIVPRVFQPVQRTCSDLLLSLQSCGTSHAYPTCDIWFRWVRSLVFLKIFTKGILTTVPRSSTGQKMARRLASTSSKATQALDPRAIYDENRRTFWFCRLFRLFLLSRARMFEFVNSRSYMDRPVVF